METSGSVPKHEPSEAWSPKINIPSEASWFSYGLQPHCVHRITQSLGAAGKCWRVPV